MHKVTVTFSKFVIYVFVNIVFDFASLLEIYINEEKEKSNFMLCLFCCALDQFWEFSLRDTVLFVAREIKWVQLGAFSEHWPLMSAIALVTAIGDKRTEWNTLWWDIRKMVPVINDEKCLQIFLFTNIFFSFLSFHLKWKFITSSTWCSMLCPSICWEKEVGWQFTLPMLNCF